MNDHYFLLFSSCIKVKGFSESLIYDTERRDFYPIPNDIFDFLEETKNTTIGKLKQQYGSDEIIDGFIQQFLEQEVGFLCKNPANFPKMDLNWYSPHFIESAIIEISNESDFDLADVLNQLNALFCQNIQLRFLRPTSPDEIENLLKPLNKSIIRYFEVFIPHQSHLSELAVWKPLFQKHERLGNVVIFGSPTTESKTLWESQKYPPLHFIEKQLNAQQADYLQLNTFEVSLPIFSEAQKHNIALNRQVSIDANGNIKNYLNHLKIFGNVQENSLKDVIENKEFQEKWFIANDKVAKCQDCQYRYACNFHADLEQIDGVWHKMADCGFDPYENKWK